MNIQELSSFKYPIKNVLIKMESLNKCRKDFILTVFGLFLSVKGRINFLQLERFSSLDEQSFRNNFEKRFDFLNFNKELVLDNGSGHFTIAFDPSYISKSGKSTPGVNYFWSGVAGKSKWGLEICGIAAIDIDNHTAFHLEAVQTIGLSEDETLLNFYAKILLDRKKELLLISKYVVVDAYFSKQNFVMNLVENGFQIVSRLRDDADLNYKFIGKQKTGKGRPKKYDGKIDYKNLKENYFEKVQETENTIIYGAIVYSKSLKREIKIVTVYTKRKDKWSHKIYFSTDYNLGFSQILEYYQTRFQIEFLYRDGKQHTGLNDCQARSENKLAFHFNTALTTINIAKITHWLPTPKESRKTFSMADVKTVYHNELMLKRFLHVFAIKPYLMKNKSKIQELLDYGKIAA